MHRKTAVYSDNSIYLCDSDNALSDQDAAGTLLRTFSLNFSNTVPSSPRLDEYTPPTPPTVSLSHFNCTPSMVTAALIQCPNSNSSPDGISFKLLKAVSDLIISPLNTIFQHSLLEGIFPTVWKEATVIPLFIGKDSRVDPSSYRPISLCQCIGKILERIVHTQLIKYIDDNQFLCSRQHGFISGRSTLNNLLDSEAKICDIINSRHPYEILSFDFAKAFDKASHRYVIEAATSFGICGKALEWLSSLSTCRTFRVRVGDALSVSVDVTSGIIQGSTLIIRHIYRLTTEKNRTPFSSVCQRFYIHS